MTRTADIAPRTDKGKLLPKSSMTPNVAAEGFGQSKVKKAAPAELPAFLSKQSVASRHFNQVYRRAIEVIGNADKAMRWLGRPIPALNFATPVSLLKNEKGRDAVLEVLGRLEHGVF